jgi:hypothetical protein
VEPEELQGEWTGEILAIGPLYPLAYLVVHWLFGYGEGGSA